MRILRHAQISMTMEVYTEVPDDITRAALKKLGDSLGGRRTQQACHDDPARPITATADDRSGDAHRGQPRSAAPATADDDQLDRRTLVSRPEGRRPARARRRACCCCSPRRRDM